MELIKKLKQFISYWYVRYLLVTELYMVEPWERVIVHILFAILFGMFWYFNYSIISSGLVSFGKHRHRASSKSYEEFLSQT